MLIKQDPITKLWCREDGAVLMPPTGYTYKKYRWTFGSLNVHGYLQVGFHHKYYKVHQIVCRAFHGLPPGDKLDIDHINRIKSDNRPCNLRWASRKENAGNTDRVDISIEKYGVRFCDDSKAYSKAHNKDYGDKMKAQGLSLRKGPDGKCRWLPRIRKRKGGGA